MHEEEFKATLKSCSMNECRLYTMVDIKRHNSMSLCVIMNKSLDSFYCNTITCTCNKKEKRGIKSPVHETTNSGGNKIQLESASCYITNNKDAHWPVPFSEQHRTTKNVAKVQRKTNNIQDNTSLKEISRDRQDAKDKGTEMIYIVFVYHYIVNKTNGALNIVFIHPVIVSLQLQ